MAADLGELCSEQYIEDLAPRLGGAAEPELRPYERQHNLRVRRLLEVPGLDALELREVVVLPEPG